MHSSTIAIDRKSLLEEANRIIRDHEDYMHGMLATEVEQKGPVLVFRGEFFLDEQGIPTQKTAADAVMNARHPARSVAIDIQRGLNPAPARVIKPSFRTYFKNKFDGIARREHQRWSCEQN